MGIVYSLSLTAFRNYTQALLDLPRDPPPLIVLTGPNGAGKTNLLEAISLLVPGRGLRNARLGEVQNVAEPRPWAVFARGHGLSGDFSIGTGRDPDAATERRVVRINGQNAAGQTALADHVTAIWLTPQMDGLFRDGASERRRYLDRLVFGLDPAHAGRVSRYDKLLRERSRLLREGGADDAWLTALEGNLAETGLAIAAARRQLVQALAAACDRAQGPFPKPMIALDGWLETALAEQPALSVEDGYRAALAEGRRRDAETGGAMHGPHRSDLRVGHAAKDMPAALCSTGEQKALLIALTLANARMLTAERGGAPLMLLDEVVAHLDGERRAALFDQLAALGSQCWLTGTDPALFDMPSGDAIFFIVSEGRVTPGS